MELLKYVTFIRMWSIDFSSRFLEKSNKCVKRWGISGEVPHSGVIKLMGSVFWGNIMHKVSG